jgi:hypothetical protein
MILHVATTDLATVGMLLANIADHDSITLSKVILPVWTVGDQGVPEFPNKFAVNTYLILDVADRATAATWWEEWADYIRTDLKNPYPDEEYEWIENPEA